MSSYQYYEFRTVDRPLSEKDMEALEGLSSRAQITPTSFVNVYNYGDFRGNPEKLVETYFDAFLYVSSFGIHELMFRIPLKLIDVESMGKYCTAESITIDKKNDNLIVDFRSDTEDNEWEEGEGWLSSLISLRSDIIDGDYRSLYLAWLSTAGSYEMEDEMEEPPVPPNLAKLNAPLTTFIDFMRIDPDLVAVAAENSAEEHETERDVEGLKSWINGLTEDKKDEIIFRLINDNDPHLRLELRRSYKESRSDHSSYEEYKPRTAAELLEQAESRTNERIRRETEQKERERMRLAKEAAVKREKYLNGLMGKEDELWIKVNTLIEVKKAKEYDEAVNLLLDLKDLSAKQDKTSDFRNRLKIIREENSRKPAFIRRLGEKNLKL